MFLKNVMFWHFVFLQIAFCSENNNPQFYVVSTTQKPPKLHEEPKPVKLEIYLNNLVDSKLESILQNQYEQNGIVSKMENYIKELKSEILILKNDYNQRKSLCENDTRIQLQNNFTKTYLENSHDNLQKLIESELQNQFKQHNNIVNEMKSQIETTGKEILTLKEHNNEYKKLLETEIQTNLTLYKQLLISYSNDTKTYMENVNNKLAELILPKSCIDVQKSGKFLSGVYTIRPDFSPKSFDVRCEMETRGGGWIYLVNRFDGSVNFDLNWSDYKNGFGNLNGEFWLGLEYLYILTKNKPSELLIEFVKRDLKKIYIHYKQFSIGDEGEGYRIKTLKGYSGNANNNFDYHLGNKFSTKDRDQDYSPRGNCAKEFGGGFWYNRCFYFIFTGFHNSYWTGSNREIRVMIRSQ